MFLWLNDFTSPRVLKVSKSNSATPQICFSNLKIRLPVEKALPSAAINGKATSKAHGAGVGLVDLDFRVLLPALTFGVDRLRSLAHHGNFVVL